MEASLRLSKGSNAPKTHCSMVGVQVSHWREMVSEGQLRIGRPRQMCPSLALWLLPLCRCAWVPPRCEGLVKRQQTLVLYAESCDVLTEVCGSWSPGVCLGHDGDEGGASASVWL